MKRVENNEKWSLFDPKEAPRLPDLFGEAFEEEYIKLEKSGRAVKSLPSRKLYAKMMKSLAETGNGWMNFKDHSNRKSNQTQNPENVIHLSNLCTEILEVTSEKKPPFATWDPSTYAVILTSAVAMWIGKNWLATHKPP